MATEPARRIALLAAPTNLGLRPPRPGSVPGCAKAPEALRDAGLHRRLAAAGALDAGVVIPGRYVDSVEEGRSQNEDALLEHTGRVADRLGRLLDDGRYPVLLGGDCSLLVAGGVALARRGRYGLVHLDGHTDFRHPGNTDRVEHVAGEDLAAAIGRHRPAIADIDGLGPYFRPGDAVHAGCRGDDEHLAEVTAALAAVVPAAEIRRRGVAATAGLLLETVDSPRLDGFWLHLDVDILDCAHLPAVDSPEPDGLDPAELVDLLGRLAPLALGCQITIFDPDLDLSGTGAALLAEILVAGLAGIGTRTL